MADAAQAAAQLLARREHTRQELAEKLRARGFCGEELETALNRMEENDILSDARFARAYVREKWRQFGDWRLRMELARRGVDEAEIATALNEPRPPEQERAAAVLAAKYPAGVNAANLAQATRFLRQRGFGADATVAACRDASGAKRENNAID